MSGGSVTVEGTNVLAQAACRSLCRAGARRVRPCSSRAVHSRLDHLDKAKQAFGGHRQLENLGTQRSEGIGKRVGNGRALTTSPSTVRGSSTSTSMTSLGKGVAVISVTPSEE